MFPLSREACKFPPAGKFHSSAGERHFSAGWWEWRDKRGKTKRAGPRAEFAPKNPATADFPPTDASPPNPIPRGNPTPPAPTAGTGVSPPEVASEPRGGPIPRVSSLGPIMAPSRKNPRFRADGRFGRWEGVWRGKPREMYLRETGNRIPPKETRRVPWSKKSGKLAW